MEVRGGGGWRGVISAQTGCKIAHEQPSQMDALLCIYYRERQFPVTFMLTGADKGSCDFHAQRGRRFPVTFMLTGADEVSCDFHAHRGRQFPVTFVLTGADKKVPVTFMLTGADKKVPMTFMLTGADKVLQRESRSDQGCPCPKVEWDRGVPILSPSCRLAARVGKM